MRIGPTIRLSVSILSCMRNTMLPYSQGYCRRTYTCMYLRPISHCEPLVAPFGPLIFISVRSPCVCTHSVICNPLTLSRSILSYLYCLWYIYTTTVPPTPPAESLTPFVRIYTCMFSDTFTQGGICREGRGGFSPSLHYVIPFTGWLLAIPGRDTFYPMHSIHASNYPPPITAYVFEFL